MKRLPDDLRDHLERGVWKQLTETTKKRLFVSHILLVEDQLL